MQFSVFSMWPPRGWDFPFLSGRKPQIEATRKKQQPQAKWHIPSGVLSLAIQNPQGNLFPGISQGEFSDVGEFSGIIRKRFSSFFLGGGGSFRVPMQKFRFQCCFAPSMTGDYDHRFSTGVKHKFKFKVIRLCLESVRKYNSVTRPYNGVLYVYQCCKS
jgi:hypothetical protein